MNMYVFFLAFFFFFFFVRVEYLGFLLLFIYDSDVVWEY